MKISLSASYFKCPPVRAILDSCDIVYSTNEYAIDTLLQEGLNTRLLKCGDKTRVIKKDFVNQGIEVITFSDLRQTFINWVNNEATLAELEEWTEYFGVKTPEEIRVSKKY